MQKIFRICFALFDSLLISLLFCFSLACCHVTHWFSVLILRPTWKGSTHAILGLCETVCSLAARDCVILSKLQTRMCTCTHTYTHFCQKKVLSGPFPWGRTYCARPAQIHSPNEEIGNREQTGLERGGGNEMCESRFFFLSGVRFRIDESYHSE